MFLEVTSTLLGGFGYTCLLFFTTLIFSLPLGLAISFCSMSKFAPLKYVTKVFVWIIRGVPLMLQLFIVYYVPSMVGWTILVDIDNFLFDAFGFNVGSALIASIIAFSINYACYFSEIFRGGIESIPKGQTEAGKVLGMSKGQIFKSVIFMQVIKRTLPPMSNEIITLVKDTALANSITVVEIIMEAKLLMTQSIIWPFFYSGVFYLIFVGVLTLLFGYLEKKLNYYKV